MNDEHKTKQQLIAELGALRHVFDGAGDAICIVDRDGRILEVNQAAHQCLGYSHAEMLHMTLADIHPPDQAPLVAQRLAAARDQGSVLFETTQRRRDGTIVPVEVHARPIEFNGAPAVLCVIRDITQRKRPEEALLRTLVDTMPLAVYVKDTLSRFVLANQGIAEVMGVETPQELLGKTDFDYFPHDIAAGFYAGEQELMQSGRPVINHEESALDAAGRPRWFLNTAVPWRDAAGSIVGLVGVSHDVTDRKQADEALREQKEILQTVLDNAPVMTEFLNPDGTLGWVNRTWERVLGWSLAEGQTRDMFQEFYPDAGERQRVLDFIAQADGTWEDFWVRRRDGTPIDTSWVNVRLPDGAIVGIGQDITERKQIEEALKASEKRFRDIVLSSADWIWEVDSRGRYTFASEKVTDTLGYTPEELLGKTPFDLMPEDEARRVGEIFQGIASGKKHIVDLENWNISKDGKKVCLLTNGVPMLDVHGDLLGYRGLDKDITERKRVEEEIANLAKFPSENPNPVLRLTHDGIVLYANEGSQAMLRDWRSEVGGYAPTFLRDLASDAFKGHSLQTVDVEFEEHVYSFAIAPVTDAGYVNVYGSEITQRKQAEEALREQKEILQTVLDNAPIMTEFLMPDGTQAWANRTWEGVLGWSHADAQARNLFLEFYPDAEERRRVLDFIARADGTWEDFRARRRDGTLVDTSWVNVRLHDGSTVGIGQDITKRKLTEQALRETNEKLTRAQRVAHIGSWEDYLPVGDARWSEEMYNILGFPPGTPIDVKEATRVFPPEESERYRQAIEAAINEDAPYSMDYRIVRLDGSVRWIHDEGEIVRDEHGKAIGMFGTTQDITERKQAEEALRQQKEILQTVLDNAPVATEFLKPDGSLQWANRTAERILGWSLTERQAPGVFEKFYPDADERQRALDFITRADGTWEDFRERRRDGSVIDISWANVRLPDGSIVGIGQDISERKRAEAERERLQAQLLQSQRMEAVGQLATGIAHDFNNLLTAILGFAELLQLGMPPQDQRQEMVSHILTGGQRAAVLVNQLLGFARRQMIAPRELNLNEIVAGASATVRRDLEPTIDLTVLPAPDLWPVTVDPEQFARVIHDLALNARRAMPGGGRLTIETANVTLSAEDMRARPEIQPGDYVLLSVGDTGAGMSREAAARVFEPFFFTSREVASGVGLRMAAVYGIVKQNHGYIYAESREGAGTTIKVYLPRGEAPQDDLRWARSRA